MLVYLFDALGSVVSFSYHFHFYLGALHRISFADHGAECAVTAEVGIARHQ